MRNRKGISMLRELVACTVLVSYLTACTSWRVQDLSPQQLLAAKQPSVIRVTRSDGMYVVLTQPQVSGDSLVGWTEGGRRLSIPLTDIASVAHAKVDAGKTVGLMVGLTAFAVAFLGVLVAIQCSQPHACD